MRKSWLALLLGLCLLLSGCSAVPLTALRAPGDVVLPEPELEAPSAPIGDSRAERVERVTFSVIGQDGQQLTQLSRMLRVSGEDSLPERVAKRLLDGSASAGMTPCAPEGTELLGCELSEGILTIDLSVDALALDAQALAFMRAALVNTLTGLPDIQYVNVLIDGKEESATSLPTGTLAESDGNLTALWAQQQADEARFQTDPASAQIDRELTLYFAAWQDNRLLPQMRAVTLVDDNFVSCVLNELHRGPSSNPLLHDVLPKEATLLAEPRVTTLADGRRVAQIAFKGDLYAQLEQAGISPYHLFAAMTLSICRFVPELSGIMVGVQGELVESVQNGALKLPISDGVMRPADFDESIGRVARLYFPNDAGQLVAVDRVLDRESATSPRALIEQLMAGPFAFDQGAKPIFPAGVTGADLLGVHVEDGLACLNFSSNFYRLCQELSANDERSLVYALVNTLCGLPDVSRARLYIAGDTVETLSQTICLRGELLPNPGLVAIGLNNSRQEVIS